MVMLLENTVLIMVYAASVWRKNGLVGPLVTHNELNG